MAIIKKTAARLSISLVAACVALVLAELAYRGVNDDPDQVEARMKVRSLMQDGSSSFTPWPFVGFIPKSKASQAGDSTRPKNWSFEFGDHDKPRVACLGGSTTWGGYPQVLKKGLEATTGAAWDVMNWGVSSWSTQETMVNYFTNVQDYAPDIIILHHSLNDMAARTWGEFRGDYGHYRKPWVEPVTPAWERQLFEHSDFFTDQQLEQNSSRFTLSRLLYKPKTSNLNTAGSSSQLDSTTSWVYERNMRTIIEHARSKGTRVMIMTMPYKPSTALPLEDETLPLWAAGMQEHNQIGRELAAEFGCALVDGEAWSRADPEGTEEFFVDRVHMTNKGFKGKVGLILAAMTKEHWQKDLAKSPN